MSDLFEQFIQAEKVPIVEPANVENTPPPAPVHVLVQSADCPARVHRIVQPTLFDCSQQYQ